MMTVFLTVRKTSTVLTRTGGLVSILAVQSTKTFINTGDGIYGNGNATAGIAYKIWSYGSFIKRRYH